MTIVAVCGPVGSDLKTFSEKCYSLLNKETTLLINYANTSLDKIISIIDEAKGDIIIFGSGIFLNEDLLPKIGVKVFLELDADLCLSNHVKSLENTLNLNAQIDHYFNEIKPFNDKIRQAANKIANVIRPQLRSNDILIDLLINKKDKTLYQISSSNSLLTHGFWKPENENVKIPNNISINLGKTLS